MRRKGSESHNIRSFSYPERIKPVAYSDSDRVRFAAKYERRGDHECWFWQSATSPIGYGTFGMRRESPRYAHRVAWELANGPIPAGLMVCHRCDQRNCVNPAHLFIGTQFDNMRDASQKGRLATGPRPNNQKVTDAVVAEMRALLAAGEMQKLIAERFGVSKGFVCQIASGKRRPA